MANSQTESDNGIPGLKDIPLIGRLFKSTSRKNTKTELVVMIVPYIIESADQADAITRAVTSQLENLSVPGVTPDEP